MNYVLVQQDEDGVEQLWGECAGVEGLFVEPIPPPREVLTLRGCRPDGPLSEVLSEPDVSLRALGDVCVEMWDDEEPVQRWALGDAVVVAHQPDAADPARYDIVLGASVTSEKGFHELPVAPRFELFAGTTVAAASAGRCYAVDGLFEPRVDPAPVPMELLGCEPAEPLLAALRRPRRWEKGWPGHRRSEAVRARRHARRHHSHRWRRRAAITIGPSDLGAVVPRRADRAHPLGAVRLAGQSRVAGPHHACLAGARAPPGPVRR